MQQPLMQELQPRLVFAGTGELQGEHGELQGHHDEFVRRGGGCCNHNQVCWNR